ncbi:MAG: methyltransferase domain-containing protein [SAR324 cluster bacterium]|nr:methyltransferase domain-containing protein [SAR324 cluster bacterium]
MTDPMRKFVDVDELREHIRVEYREVAKSPDKGFHFHTGRPLAKIVLYKDEWLTAVPEEVLASFAGTGNPFSMGEMQPGERVVDLGCGAGIDSFIAAAQVGKEGAVVGIDMTEEMLAKAAKAKERTGLPQLEFKHGYLEDIPISDGWADTVISNGVVNLCPDKPDVFKEILRILRPGGRIQIGDILVTKPVPESAKENIALWTG